TAFGPPFSPRSGPADCARVYSMSREMQACASSLPVSQGQTARRESHVGAEGQGQRPAKTVPPQHIHADADRLRAKHHSVTVAQHEGGVGGGELMSRELR